MPVVAELPVFMQCSPSDWQHGEPVAMRMLSESIKILLL